MSNRDDLEPRFHGTYHVTADLIAYALGADVRFCAIGGRLVDEYADLIEETD